MKILVFGRNQTDYMQDDLYHGLKSLYGTDVECNTHIEYLYKDYQEDLAYLYGRGFSYAKNLDPALRVVVSEKEISEKLDSKYYDAVIYLSFFRCNQQFDEVTAKVDKNKIGVIDGEDDTLMCFSPPGFKTFKRELLVEPTASLFPISFAMPEEKIWNEPVEKLQMFSNQVPIVTGWIKQPNVRNRLLPLDYKFNTSSYQFKNEKDYYDDYKKSKYAFTFKKGGWDCKRHYEILANKCIPLFPDVDDLPQHIMTTYPKKFLSDVYKNYFKVTNDVYNQWLEYLFDYTKNNLTTKHLAKYVLDKIL